MRRLLFIAALMIVPHAASALELIMVEQRGCHYCTKWKETIGPIYPKTEVSQYAPLTKIDLSDANSAYQTARPVVFTPTFLIVDDAGKELHRLEGYQSEDFFWALLEEAVDRLSPDYTRP